MNNWDGKIEEHPADCIPCRGVRTLYSIAIISRYALSESDSTD